MRTAAIILAGLSLAACSAPAGDQDRDPEPAATAAPVESPAATATSAEPTFWDLAPLGDGQYLRVHIDDRARAGDCAELASEFERVVSEDPVEGFTHEVLAYIQDQATAADCSL